MDIHNSQFGADIEYDSFDLGTPAWVVKPGPAAIPAIPFVPGTPIASENFEGTLWNDIPFAFGDWEVTSSTSHLGTKCFRGKTGIGKTTTTFAIYDFFGSDQVSFWYKNPGFVTGFVNDKFEVLFDGTPVFTQLDVVNDWTYVSITLNFAFEIDFVFTKNFPIIDDTDTVFLDDLVLGGFDTPGVPGSPAHPYVYTPMYLCGEDNRLLVSPALQVTLETPEQIVGTENFETDPISGSGTWALSVSSPHTGARCLKAATITNSQTTDYTFTIPGGANGIRFWDRVSSENNFDWFRVYKDVVDPDNLLYQQSGTANTWTQHTFDISGATQIIFRYSKDSSDSSGLDTAFIDDIEWFIASIPASTVCAPFNLDSSGALTIRPLDCAIDSITICPGDDPIIVELDGTIAVSGTVNVGNFPAVAHLACATDSVTICQGGALSVTVLNPAPTVSGTVPVSGTINVGNFPAVAHLNCSTDSVEICNDAGSPITVSGTVSIGNIPHVIVDSLPEVEIKNDSGNPIPVSFSRLTCATDSVEICNDVGSPITVSGTVTANQGTSPWVVSGTVNIGTIPEVEIKNDSGNPIPVNGTVNIGTMPEVEIKNDSGNPVPVSFTRLTCATDSVEICNDAGSPITVNVTNTPHVIVDLLPALTITGSVAVTGNVSVNDVYTPQSVFYAPFGENNFTTAADAATGGRLWLVNTTSQLVVIREVRFTCVITSLIDLGSALPVLTMERMSFTGSPSGAQITPCKRDTADPNNVATLRTANTGMTITAGALARKFSPPNLSVIGGLLSANTAVSTPAEQVFQPQDRRLLILRQGEGVVFRQATAGNATEGRAFVLNIMWEELP